jgi:alpha-acetolactate decarboxylase
LLEGKLGAAVSLGTFAENPNLVGIGSLSGLRGEIAIMDGAIWVSYASGEGTQAERLERPTETAAFAATSEVRTWVALPLDDAVPYERIPEAIERAASRTNLDRARPFPVVIEGDFSELKFNVVDGSALTNDEPSRDDMLRTAKKISVPRARGSLVGYYAEHDTPELIHPGQRIHLHVILPEAKQMGHLDAVSIDSGARLRLPVR